MVRKRKHFTLKTLTGWVSFPTVLKHKPTSPPTFLHSPTRASQMEFFHAHLWPFNIAGTATPHLFQFSLASLRISVSLTQAMQVTGRTSPAPPICPTDRTLTASYLPLFILVSGHPASLALPHCLKGKIVAHFIPGSAQISCVF